MIKKQQERILFTQRNKNAFSFIHYYFENDAMKKLFTALTLTALATTVATQTMAATEVAGATGKINFVGTVVEGACHLSADQKDQVVDFGDVGRGNLNNGGVATKDFSITLTDCDPTATIEGLDTTTASAIEIQFNSGKANATDVQKLNNTPGAANATGVLVNVISKLDGANVNFNGTTSNITQTLVSGDMTFPFEAAVSSPNKDATTGKIETDTDFVVYYK